MNRYAKAESKTGAKDAENVKLLWAILSQLNFTNTEIDFEKIKNDLDIPSVPATRMRWSSLRASLENSTVSKTSKESKAPKVSKTAKPTKKAPEIKGSKQVENERKIDDDEESSSKLVRKKKVEKPTKSLGKAAAALIEKAKKSPTMCQNEGYYAEVASEGRASKEHPAQKKLEDVEGISQGRDEAQYSDESENDKEEASLLNHTEPMSKSVEDFEA